MALIPADRRPAARTRPTRGPRAIVGVLCLLGLVAGGPAAAPAGATGFNPALVKLALRTVSTGWDEPILVTNAGDGSGRMFVVEQTGRVRVLAGGPSGSPFLDIGSRITFGGEQGLLGLAFHPSFATNGKLFVDYTRAGDGATVIDEYRVTTNPNDVDETATRRQILAIAQPYPNHNGGGIAFGPDGFLYIGMGDGGSGGDPQDRAQNVNSFLGKMLRIDVNGTSAGKAYRVPPSNPFVGRTGLDEIWAYGLRNPWRWSFDRITGDLWIGDVGQARYEEIDRSTATSGRGRGVNYGWDDMEGNHCFEPLSGCLTAGRTLPLVEYSHAGSGGGNCAVTGGYVYRGQRYTLLRGGYLFADYCSGRIWIVSATATRPATPRLLLDTSALISSFGQSQAGELSVVDLGPSRHAGTISRIVETSGVPSMFGR